MKTNDTNTDSAAGADSLDRIVRSITEWESWAGERLSFGERAALLNPVYFSAEIKQASKDYNQGMRVSKSLRMQKDTGIPHCVCCLKPTADKGLRFLPSANVAITDPHPKKDPQ
jgi:hypothetical protein